MTDIPTLRVSENSNPPLSAREEFGQRDSSRDWEGQWVPRDQDGDYVGPPAYFTSSYMRDEYPGIVLIKDGEVFHD